MAKIRKFNPAARIVILMGAGSSPESVSEWLNLAVLEETRRPVDLRLGVLFRGTFHFRGFNNHDEDDEKWLQEFEQIEESPVDPQTFFAIKLLAERGEQTIIFTSTKRSAVSLARYLAEKLDFSAAKNVLNGLNDLPPSIQNEILGQCLFGSTAFHHAELDQDQRGLVENGFRSGEIKILVSTTTLAWGVNLPAKNVFIESMKYSGSRSFNCKDTLIPLSTVDFSQAAGRAGRIGYDKDYGRAILSAASPFEHEILWDNYIYGEAMGITPGLSENRLPEFTARLISCGAVDSKRGMQNSITDTFWSGHLESENNVVVTALSTLDFLEKSGLVHVAAGDRLSATRLGEILSSSGFSAKSIIDIYEKSVENELSTALDWIYFSFGLIEWRDNCGYCILNHVSSDDLYKRLNELSGGVFENSDYLALKLIDAKGGQVDRRFSELLFALEWISGRPTRDLETLFNRGSGGLRQDALLLCWIINTISKVLEIVKIPADDNKSIAKELSILALELKHGLPAEKISLAATFNLDREFVNRLFDFGITCADDLRDADLSFLKEILPHKILSAISQKINRLNRVDPNIPHVLMRDCNSDAVFTGKHRKLKKELKIMGKSVFLQPRLYSYFQKLWWGLQSENTWVHKESLEPGINQPKYISKLRRIFKENEIDIKIISDGSGCYRLLLPERENDTVIAGND